MIQRNDRSYCDAAQNRRKIQNRRNIMGANEIQAQAQILFAKYGYENTSLSGLQRFLGLLGIECRDCPKCNGNWQQRF